MQTKYEGVTLHMTVNENFTEHISIVVGNNISITLVHQMFYTASYIQISVLYDYINEAHTLGMLLTYHSNNPGRCK